MKSSRTILKWVLPVLLIGGGVGIAAILVHFRRPIETIKREPLLPLVKVEEPRRADFQHEVRTHGTARPQTQINLVAEVAGRVTKVSPALANGGFFETGDLLLQLEPRDYELAVIRARAALAQAEVQLQREEAEVEVARREWEELGGGNASPLALRQPQLAEARATVDSAKASLDMAELELSRCRIQAPFTGRVLSKKVDLGQFINRGEVVAHIFATDFAEVRLPIPLDQLEYLPLSLNDLSGQLLEKGPEVQLRARFGLQEHAWTGRIVRSEGEIDNRTRMLGLVARIANPYVPGKNVSTPLPVGLFVEGIIQGRVSTNVFVVPRAAYYRSGEVAVVDRENRLRFRKVSLDRLEREVVIVREGIEPGDRICVSPLDTAVDGMTVRVAEPETKAARL